MKPPSASRPQIYRGNPHRIATPPREPLFPTVTGTHWGRGIARSRAETNSVSQKIRATLTAQAK